MGEWTIGQVSENQVVASTEPLEEAPNTDWLTEMDLQKAAFSIGRQNAKQPPTSGPCGWIMWDMSFCRKPPIYRQKETTLLACEEHKRCWDRKGHKFELISKDVPLCQACSEQDGIYLVLENNLHVCSLCRFKLFEGMQVVAWGSSPTHIPHQVEHPHGRTSSLWDFLMKTSFLSGLQRPPAWMKAKVDEWFKLDR